MIIEEGQSDEEGGYSVAFMLERTGAYESVVMINGGLAERRVIVGVRRSGSSYG